MALAGGEKSDDKYNTISQVNGRTDGQNVCINVARQNASARDPQCTLAKWQTAQRYSVIERF